jgi:hypothetical protein
LGGEQGDERLQDAGFALGDVELGDRREGAEFGGEGDFFDGVGWSGFGFGRGVA